MAEGKPKDALASANIVVANNPNSPSGLYLKGTALKEMGAYDEAMAALQATLKTSPTATPAMLQLADISLTKGNAEGAIDFATQAVRRNPRSGTAHLILAKSLVKLRRLDAAEPEVKGLVKASATSVAVQTLEGDFYWAKHDLVHARQAYERALQLSPRAGLPSLIGLLRIDLTEKKPDAARSRIESQLAKTPDDPALLIVAGEIYSDLKDLKKSEAMFQHLLQVDPTNIRAYVALGSIYVGQHRVDEAIKRFEEVAKRDKRLAPAALTMTGQLLALQGQQDAARKHFEEALSLNPQMPIAANDLAWDYAERGGNLDVALKWAQTAKAKMPDSPFPNDTLGWIYYKKGLNSLAVTSFEDAVKQAPADSSIRYRLGLAYLKVGEQKKAKTALEQALKMSSEFKEAADAKRALSSITIKG
jgi:tetratricopeptide (TPR) repeat protein